ncbi:MAG: hypothetical protein GXP39_02350 [Chloroflexi bacterium]|nr:hypothetical protein [Chloroflexota bacterium]
MDAKATGEGWARWGIAAIILVAFLGLMAYQYAPAWLPKAFRLTRIGLSRSVERVSSPHFEIDNRSDASPEQIQKLQNLLEEQYAVLTRFLRREPPEPIQVEVLQEGNLPALPVDGHLQLSYNGYVDTEMAGLALGILIAGKPDPIFASGGVALYALEEMDMLPVSIHQKSDAWVTWLVQRDQLLPLEQALDVSWTSPPADILRSVVEGASFSRWLVARAGWDAYWQWFDGADFESTFGMPPSEAEAAWLSDVLAQELEPLPCGAALSGSLSRVVCRELER